jgi:hypothetical protein
MANDRIRPDDSSAVPGEGRPSDSRDDREQYKGVGEDIRSTADEEDDDFDDDMEDLEDDDNDSSF